MVLNARAALIDSIDKNPFVDLSHPKKIQEIDDDLSLSD
jgi:hypothetical protein